jgi:hypothetical protein
MVGELRRVLERAERQPESVQRQIAKLIEAELEQTEWESIVSSRESQDFLAELAAEARVETAAGKTRDLDEIL